jgi:fumarylacetoacetate (FAA) hydrolase
VRQQHQNQEPKHQRRRSQRGGARPSLRRVAHARLGAEQRRCGEVWQRWHHDVLECAGKIEVQTPDPCSQATSFSSFIRENSTLKLATYRDGSSDGQLVVVSRDLSMAHYATGIASRLQSVLDDWNFIAPQLEDLSTQLQSGRSRHAFAFEPGRCMAPLPRPGLHVQGNAYPSHAAHLLQAQDAMAGAVDKVDRSVQVRPEVDGQPGRALLCAAAAGDFLGPCADLVLAGDAADIDCVAALAVVTGELPMGTGADRAIDGIRLLMLTHSVLLRGRMPRGGGGVSCCLSVDAQPAVACAPVAVTPDELGTAWKEGRIHLSLHTQLDGRKMGRCEAGASMQFHFGDLVAQLAAQRRVPSGAVVGSGPVSNPGEIGDDAGALKAWPRGAHCIAERRAIETFQDGAPRSRYLRLGDRMRSEMNGIDGVSVFGAIDQVIAAPI